MWRIYSEWDIGETDLVFTNEAAIEKWLMENKYIQAEAKEHEHTVAEEIAEQEELGLLSYVKLTVIE